MSKTIGMGGSVSLGSAVYPVSTWSVDVKNGVEDVTDTASGAWVSKIPGISEAEISFTAFWGSAVAELSTAFAIGTAVAASLAIGSGGGTVSGTFIIGSFKITNPAKNAVTFECTGQSTGTVTFA